MTMQTLAIDLETYSGIDLSKSGVYAYCEADDFEVLLFGYAVDDGSVQIVDLASGEKIPTDILVAITDPKVIKTAYNANFERTCLAKYLKAPMLPEQWRCSSVHALMLGLPGYLDGVAKCLKLENQKMKEGKALIRYFSVPCKPTKANGGRVRNLPKHDPEKWSTFKDYCKQDVEVERQLRKKLEAFPIPEVEQKLWELDQHINDTGVLVDTSLAKNAIYADIEFQKQLFDEATQLTGLDNPNSPAQLKGWLQEQGFEVDSLAKKNVEELLETVENPTVKRVLEPRQAMAKTSIRKYEAMMRSYCGDERIRGLLQFYGANRTGRWCLAEGSPVLVKTPHGLIQNKSIEAVETEDLVWDGDEWVSHEGVVFSGNRDVITWDGVTATPEHIVYISDFESMTLGEAVERGLALWKGNLPFTK